MTLSETRKLGIEFERRVQTMIPDKEYLDKLDTETIYAYLNSYQDKYIHDIYRNLDQIKSGSKMSAHVESILQEMLRTQTISVEKAKDYTGNITDTNGVIIIENGRSVTYPLDPSFYMYVRSVSNVTSTYAFKSNETQESDQRPIRIIPNELVSQSDVWRLLETPHNSLRILRYPAATIGAYEDFETGKVNSYTVSYYNENPMSLQPLNWPFEDDKKYTIQEIIDILKTKDPSYNSESLLNWATLAPIGIPQYDVTISGTTYRITKSDTQLPVYSSLPTLNVIYDQYTKPVGIKIVYYAQPQRFDLMTSTRCELPMDAFDDLVTGAVDLYVQYVAGAEANKRRIQEAQRQQSKQNKKDNEDED